MSITREEWRIAIDGQHAGILILYILVSDFRRLIDGADPQKLSDLAHLNVARPVYVIRFLSRFPTLISILAIITSIFGFRWWAFVIAPTIVFLHRM